MDSGREQVKIQVRREGHIWHGTEETNKRHLVGKEREKLGKDLEGKSTMDYLYKQYADMSSMAKDGGNTTLPQTPSVLRKI